MNTYNKLFGSLALSLIMIGCQAGHQTPIVDETPVIEESGSFIFAESSFLNVDSDMLAEQFHADRLPAAFQIPDSITALDAVYQILMDSLLAEDSKSFDLSTVPHLYRQYMQLRFDKTMQIMYDNLMVDSINVEDSMVTAEYEKTKEQFKVPDQYRARHIVIAGHALKKSEDSVLYRDYDNEQLDSIAHSKIAELRERAITGASFDTLAMMYSLDPGSADKGGDLGYFQLASLVSPFDSTVEHTPIGEISGIISTVFGWHIVKVEEYVPEHYQPLDSVWVQVEFKIKQNLLKQRSTAFVDSLRQVGTIAFDTAAIILDDSLHDNEDPLAYINVEDTLYGNDTLYYRDYSEQLYSYKKMRRIDGPLTFDQKVDLIETIAVRFHLLRASRALGYYTHPEVEEFSADKIKQYSVATLRKRLMNDNYQPTDDEVREYYEANIDNYQVERPIYVQHIIFADSNMAEHVRDQVSSGLDFMEAAREHYPGDPDIREAAADLGNIGPKDMPPDFWRVVQKTPVGEISKPVKTEFGYHIINVVEKKYSVSLEKATTKIKPILKDQHKREIRRDYVVSRLEATPVIYWDRRTDLYRKTLPKPASPFGP